MCTKLPINPLEERLRWVMPIIKHEVKLKDVALVFPGGKRTLERWVAAYKKDKKFGLIPKSIRPLSQPNETPIRIKERVIELRRETRLCAKKLNYKLKKENISLHDRTIRKLPYKYLKIPLAIGDLVEIDIKYVPSRIEGERYYQYTAIDCATRWRDLEIYENGDNESTLKFLAKVISVAKFRIRAIKTDNGSCFTNRYIGYLKSRDPINPRLHPLDLECQRLNIIHYLIDPGKPAQNGRVERSHRTDQEHFYDLNKFNSVLDLKIKLRKWNNYYNNLEHCALNGKTPNEMVLMNN